MSNIYGHSHINTYTKDNKSRSKEIIFSLLTTQTQKGAFHRQQNSLSFWHLAICVLCLSYYSTSMSSWLGLGLGFGLGLAVFCVLAGSTWHTKTHPAYTQSAKKWVALRNLVYVLRCALWCTYIYIYSFCQNFSRLSCLSFGFSFPFPSLRHFFWWVWGVAQKLCLFFYGALVVLAASIT